MRNKCFALIGGNLIDGSSKDVLQNSVVLIRDHIIVKTGNADTVAIPRDYKRIDVTGRTVMPGIMDLHVHLNMGEHDLIVPSAGLQAGLNETWGYRTIKALSYAQKALERGITTLRDVGDNGNVAVSVRDAINNGITWGPKIYTSGQYLTTTGGHLDLMPLWLRRTDDQTNVADGTEGVLRAVRQQIKMKNDWIKFYATGGVMDAEDKQEFNDDELAVLVGEAHAKEKRICAHCMHARGTLAAVKAGIDSVEHGTELTEEIVQLMVQKGTYYVPTLSGVNLIVNKGEEFGLPKVYIERFLPVKESHEKSFKLALDMGVKIGAGTDAGFNVIKHGNSATELEHFVALGMTPMEAIITATSNSASVLGMSDKLGTIEEGKLADVIIVEGDPLQDIRILQNQDMIGMVIKGGYIYIDKL